MNAGCAQELLVHMGGLNTTADLSDTQLQCMAGGPTLQALSLHVAALTSKKPIRRLRDVLLEGLGHGPLVVPLFVLICRQIDHALFHDVDSFAPAPLKVRLAVAVPLCGCGCAAVAVAVAVRLIVCGPTGNRRQV